VPDADSRLAGVGAITMTRDELLKFTKSSFDEMQALLERKNSDYAGASVTKNAFNNFMLVEHMGLCSAEVGILTRMSDKMARITKFVQKGEFAVNDESIKDTLQDLANYSILLSALITWKSKCAQPSGPS
jgi:hypothetical protein